MGRAPSQPVANTVIGMATPFGAGASANTAQAMRPQTPPQGVQSGWAPGPAPTVAPQAPAPVVAAPVVAAPQVAAPVVAAPQVAAPQVAVAPAGKKKADDGNNKGKFRETMWFKKGELDAQAAVAAAEERARTGKDVATDKADSLPIDERYKDDGSISRADKEKYSLRTGGTMMMQKMPDSGAGASMNKVGEDVLVGEMKKGRWVVVTLILVALAAIGAIVYMVAS
jgi:hypothetical protein